jgi:hypothetical protein
VTRAGALLAAMLFLALAPPPGAAQDLCVTSSWTHGVQSSNIVKPERDEYQGVIAFTRRAGCVSPGCPDGSSNTATFEVLNPVDAWFKANFSTNPASVTGNGGPLGSPRTENEIRFRLDRDAPERASFSVQVRARCADGGTSTISRSFVVGQFVDVRSSIVHAAASRLGASWLLEVRNHGTAPVQVAFEPQSDDNDAVTWTVLEPQEIAAAEAGSPTVRQFLVSMEGKNVRGNLTLTLAVRALGDDKSEPLRIIHPLPYTVFTGQSTPAPGLAVGLAFVALVVLVRRQVKA